MKMCGKRLGLVTLLLPAVFVLLAGACYAGGDAWLGVVLQPLSEELKEAMDIDEDVEGVLVSDVIDDSPADEFGLEDGDVIVAIGDEQVESVKEAVRAIKSYSPEDEVEIVLLRDGDRKKVLKVALGERDEGKMADLDLDLDLDFLPEIEHAFKGWMDEPQGFLGVEIMDMSEDLAEYFDVDEGEGVLVLEVTEDSPAEEVGLKAGDVILEFDGKEIDDSGDLVSYVRKSDPGEEVEIQIKRKRRTQTVEVELGETESASKFFVQKFKEPGKHKRVYIHPGGDLKIPDIDEIEIHRLHQEDLKEELEELREELEELREELKEMKG
jgi:C-terminal processing protease CtpA/Prc